MALAKLAKKLNDDGTILDEDLLIKISKPPNLLLAKAIKESIIE